MARRSLKLQLASPCDADWDEMEGDDAIRFCGICERNVYHLSYMTTEQVEELLHRAGQTPCVRFYERADGSVMFGDCPVGRKRTRKRNTALAAGAALASAAGLVAAVAGASASSGDKRQDPPASMGTPEAVPIHTVERPPEPPPTPKLNDRPPRRPPMGRIRTIRWRLDKKKTHK